MPTTNEIGHYIREPKCVCESCVIVLYEEEDDFVTWWDVTPDEIRESI